MLHFIPFILIPHTYLDLFFLYSALKLSLHYPLSRIFLSDRKTERKTELTKGKKYTSERSTYIG